MRAPKVPAIVYMHVQVPYGEKQMRLFEKGCAIKQGVLDHYGIGTINAMADFAREFAAEFLMPEESVRFAVLQLGIRPNDWSLKMICTLKARFNVSAEAFALRLEALGLIEKYLRQRIRDELHEHYKTHPKAMEPAPRLKSLKIGSRASILNMEVEKRGLKK
jgi:Zn-dependent peptidase ImmA (M78 family)